MSALAELEPPRRPSSPIVNYIVNDGTEIFNYTGGPGSTEVKTGGTPDPHKVVDAQRPAAPARIQARRPRLPLRRATTPQMQNFFDEDEIKRVYYPEMEALIKAESGAKRVVVFDHTLRTADDARPRGAQDPRGGAPRPQRLHRMVRPAAGARHPAGRGRRAAQAPLRHHPGVAADPLSGRDPSARHRRRPHACRSDDFVLSERRYPNRIGQTYAIAYNPKHKWFWFPRQARDEALVFKVYDSAKDGRARWTAHTAFDDPTTPPNARPRESIEIRTLAFF